MNFTISHAAAVLGLGLALALQASPAAAAGNALGGWLPLGDVSLPADGLVLTTAFVDGVQDEAGNLSGLSAVLAGDLEAAAGLPQQALDLSADDYAVEGSIALRTLNVNAGDVLRLHWAFSSLDSAFADRAFAVIGSDVFTLATALQPQGGAGTLVHSFAQGGSFLLGVGVVDTVDVLGVSTLRITGFELAAVPEPAALGLWLAGLGMLGALGRRSPA